MFSPGFLNNNKRNRRSEVQRPRMLSHTNIVRTYQPTEKIKSQNASKEVHHKIEKIRKYNRHK